MQSYKVPNACFLSLFLGWRSLSAHALVITSLAGPGPYAEMSPEVAGDFLDRKNKKNTPGVHMKSLLQNIECNTDVEKKNTRHFVAGGTLADI